MTQLILGNMKMNNKTKKIGNAQDSMWFGQLLTSTDPTTPLIPFNQEYIIEILQIENNQTPN